MCGSENDTSGAQTFSTGPNAITLRTLEAEARTPALPGLALLGVLAAFGVGFAFRRRRTV